MQVFVLLEPSEANRCWASSAGYGAHGGRVGHPETLRALRAAGAEVKVRM